MRIKGKGGFFLKSIGDGLYQLHRFSSYGFVEPIAIISAERVEWVQPGLERYFEIWVEGETVFIKRKPRKAATSTADLSSP